MIVNQINIKGTNSAIIINKNCRYVIVNGVSYPIPSYIKGKFVLQTDKNIYIDNYVFKDGSFKFSLYALFNRIFS